MPNYWNAAGQCFPLPERPLEPPDCWGPETYTGDDREEGEYEYSEKSL